MTKSNNNQYKIAIIGPSDVVSGFRALGVDIFEAYSAVDVLTQIKTIKQSAFEGNEASYAVVCVIEDLMLDMDEKEFSRVLGSSMRPKEILSEEEEREAKINVVVAGKELQNPTASYLPAIVILPGTKGSQGYAEARLRRLSEKAIGAAII